MASEADSEPTAAEVKFLGTVTSFNDQKGFGMIDCPEVQEMWGTEIYAYKDVLAYAGVGVGERVRFGIHVNKRGQPQASMPTFRVDEDGLALNVPEDVVVVNAEEAAAIDSSFLQRLKEKILKRSDHQNRRRDEAGKGEKGEKGDGRKGGKGGKMPAMFGNGSESGKGFWGGGPDAGKGFPGFGAKGWDGGMMCGKGWEGGMGGEGFKGWDGMKGAGKGWDMGKGAMDWAGKGAKGWDDGKGWGGRGREEGRGFERGAGDRFADWDDRRGDGRESEKARSHGKAWNEDGERDDWGATQEVTLQVQGIPEDATEREVGHIFRQYHGFRSLRLFPRGKGLVANVVYATGAAAQAARGALQGYIFDEEAGYDREGLIVEVAKQRRMS
eukprot:TRINITY_DN71570_c0_g1_i1.p1 TRINITY_DN71570_c0_g1~~TRINITY_DN71570_c0_g1_i1.p1  ORF type:complete len:384 (+),score=94.97 TRINITY_DN71570_c0_g1_i1:73-1224(+)